MRTLYKAYLRFFLCCLLLQVIHEQSIGQTVDQNMLAKNKFAFAKRKMAKAKNKIEKANHEYAGAYLENVQIIRHPFLLEEDEKYGGDKPFRTFNGLKYNGGYSDHLPIALDLLIRDDKDYYSK